MTEPSPIPPMPTFPDFYRAINGREPFPWQRRLASLVKADGRWPDEVGVPTGLGKTACLEIALWWLAAEADLEPALRRAPTRIWWVVNRRLLVDATASHAESLARRLMNRDEIRDRDSARIVASIAGRLRALSAGSTASPLEVIRMRGGVSPRTPTDPSRPAVILCTLPMYGSRLLFRGYGSRLRSVDAAMAGTDSLVLLDEAHLAPHLTKLIPALAECDPAARDILPAGRSRPVQVSLTATGNQDVESRLDLDEADCDHAEIRKRLNATKSVEVRNHAAGSSGSKADKGVQLLADATRELILESGGPASFLVFANTPERARGIFDRLCRMTANADADVLLLTGRMREREAQKMRDRLLDPVHGMVATRDAGKKRNRHLIAVATQTLEVGADLDAEYLVTEQCGVRALTQRLGRLNRLGRYPHARALYLHFPAPQRGTTDKRKGEWLVYGKEPNDVLRRLESACGANGQVGLSPGRIAEILGAPCDDPGTAPEIMPEILREWTKTTNPPTDEAPVEPYFSGLAGPRYHVSVIWRAHVPEEGGRLWPRAADRESIPVPIGEVREALKNDEETFRIAGDGATIERISGAGAIRPHDCVVLRSDRGLMDAFGWNPEASDPVMDVSLTGQGLPLDPDAIKRLCGVDGLSRQIDVATGQMRDGDEPSQDDRDDAASGVLESLRTAAGAAGWETAEWMEFIESLTPNVIESRFEVSRLQVRRPVAEALLNAFDEHSIAAEALDLDAHCRAVAERARAIARCIGLPHDLCDTVERAGQLHDIGKSDRRFQRWLDPDGIADAPVAKSNTPRHLWEARRSDSGWPRGGRHEALSARLVLAQTVSEQGLSGHDELRDLLIHLIISHHGRGRPLVGPVQDECILTLTCELEGATVAIPANLEQIDWDQPRRFWCLNQRFGQWGLALLEAAVIRADHAVSGGDLTGMEVRSCGK
ncbi:MAG: type I-U CRISPR-associated helicase/endonuclease Cas3 [Rhodobacteraceae bacterium]|nr:type I-U CRISPR-associated helicase/endonuclease Cas3 [Paracoccaceae bacterium]